MTYLGARSILPLPAGHSLRAHPSAEYFDEGKRAGRFAALIAPVRDTKGDLVTAHITYLQDGQKLQQREPRKLLSPLTGREGCAVRLMPLDVECMGVGEGIETCLAAAMLHEIPVWAALNTALLARFEPPSEVKHLVIFADRDLAGLEAAARLMQRLQDRATIEIRVPKAPAKDWADIGAPKALSATKAGLTPTGITPTEA
jgi:putative DNA primase/helicase